jgi:hypothetical protein
VSAAYLTANSARRKVTSVEVPPTVPEHRRGLITNLTRRSMTVDDATRPDDSSQALEDAIRVERMVLDSGPNADRNLGALAQEVRRTERDLHKIENRL